jgi:hypothetical protein
MKDSFLTLSVRKESFIARPPLSVLQSMAAGRGGVSGGVGAG